MVKPTSFMMVSTTLSEILTGNLTLSGGYWFKKDSGPLIIIIIIVDVVHMWQLQF